MTLVASNLILLSLLTALLYVILREIASRVSATAACLVFTMLFAFGQFLEIGNYNFATPYSHDLTHGVLLSVVALSCLRLYHKHQRLTFVAAAGLAVGLLYLTKVEVFLAGGAATAVAVSGSPMLPNAAAIMESRIAAIATAGVLHSAPSARTGEG